MGFPILARQESSLTASAKCSLLINAIGFYFHQIFELTDKAYQACRKKFGSKQNLWEKLRSAIHFYIRVLGEDVEFFIDVDG